MILNLPASTLEYVNADVTADVDPTGDTVEMAFTISGDPVTWHTAAWVSGASPPRTRLLVGSGAVELAAGLYTVWLRITDSPEVPVIRAGFLQIS